MLWTPRCTHKPSCKALETHIHRSAWIVRLLVRPIVERSRSTRGLIVQPGRRHVGGELAGCLTKPAGCAGDCLNSARDERARADDNYARHATLERGLRSISILAERTASRMERKRVFRARFLISPPPPSTRA
jgi:hypothetical protein